MSRIWTEDGDSSGGIGFSEDQNNEESCEDYENYGVVLVWKFGKMEIVWLLLTVEIRLLMMHIISIFCFKSNLKILKIKLP